jgi:hypothetical protein
MPTKMARSIEMNSATLLVALLVELDKQVLVLEERVELVATMDHHHTNHQAIHQTEVLLVVLAVLMVSMQVLVVLVVLVVLAVLAVLAVLVVRHTNQATLQVLASVLVLPVEMASNRHHMNHHHQLVAVSMLYHLVKLPTTHLEPMPHGPDMVLM